MGIFQVKFMTPEDAQNIAERKRNAQSHRTWASDNQHSSRRINRLANVLRKPIY